MISSGKRKIYRIDCLKYCAKNECYTLILAPRRYMHPSSGANSPLDIPITVNINAEFNLMTVNPIIECVWRDLIPEYSHCLQSSAVYTAPPCFVKFFPGRSNRSLPCQPFHMHAEETISTFLMSNIYFRHCVAKVLTMTHLLSYQMFEVFLIGRNKKPSTFREF